MCLTFLPHCTQTHAHTYMPRPHHAVFPRCPRRKAQVRRNGWKDATECVVSSLVECFRTGHMTMYARNQWLLFPVHHQVYLIQMFVTIFYIINYYILFHRLPSQYLVWTKNFKNIDILPNCYLSRFSDHVRTVH